MRDARLCYYDATLNCWVEKEYNTRWQVRRTPGDGRVGITHEVYTEGKHSPYIVLYANLDSLPVFIKEDMSVDNILHPNDVIWGNVLSSDGTKVSSYAKTEFFWVRDKDIQNIPFSMTFDLNTEENKKIREEVNLMLSNPDLFRVHDGSIRISLDQITLTGIPDRLWHHFINIASSGELGRSSELGFRFKDGYEKWIANEYQS